MLISTAPRGNLLLERHLLPAPRGLLAFAQIFTGTDIRPVVSHNAFVLSRVEVIKGNLSFPIHSGILQAPRRFLMYLSHRSALPMLFEKALVRAEGVAGFVSDLPSCSANFADNTSGALPDLNGVKEILKAPPLVRLDVDAGVSPELVHARKLLHDLVAHPAPVRTAAKRVDICLETLSRRFRSVYQIAPKEYCHRARLFEAVLRLASGATVIESALDSGFSDLKRFYAQFLRLLATTPGTYAKVKKRQDLMS
jgi:AraC-like DNA-binding protein